MSNFPNITLAYGATEKSLAEWGFTSPMLNLRSRAVSTFTVTKAGGDPAAVPDIPFEAQVTIYAQLAGLNNGAKTAIFKGRRIDINGRGDGSGRDVTIVFGDAWYDLLHTVFQHYWKVSDGSGGVENAYFSRINLFQDISAGPGSDWAYLDAQDQILEIIAYAAAISGIQIQAGTIDPVWNMPVRAVKAITCAEAIMEVLRPMPDTVTFFDYSTTPPKLHVRQRANCTAITMPWASMDGHGTLHSSSNIRPRPDLQIPQVVVQYQKINTVDGVSQMQTIRDVYPPASTGVALRAAVVPIDLRGGTTTMLKGTLITEAIDPTTTAFWKKHKPDLDDANIASLALLDTAINDGAHPDGIFITDSAGLQVDLAGPDAFPNKLISGQPASWMKISGGDPVEAVEVTIRCTLKYLKNLPTSPATLVHQAESHVVEVRMRLTDAPAGTTNYNTVGSSDAGDPAILHLAYSIWCSANNVPVNYVGMVATPPASVPPITNSFNLQWEGTHTVVEQKVYRIISPGNILNLDGPGVNTDWQTMGAAIYETQIEFFTGKTTIHFGPHARLTPQQFYEVLTTWSTRNVLENPALRNTGSAGSAAATDIGKNSPKENTVHGLPSQSVHTTFAPPDVNDVIVMFQHDAKADGGSILGKGIDSGDGTVVASYPKITLKNTDLGTIADEGLFGRELKYRVLACCDSGGNPKKIIVPASEMEDL